ncbi:hypothetical protein [Novosphingobium sp.]|nr:hypothetical protein [Novosphingobium sp.]MCC6924398.1 hypothetical protein [Novosphingobium sp.]
MARKEVCPRCGDLISREGYCINSKCIYSEEQTRKVDGARASPPFAD